MDRTKIVIYNELFLLYIECQIPKKSFIVFLSPVLKFLLCICLYPFVLSYFSCRQRASELLILFSLEVNKSRDFIILFIKTKIT